jgi:hypothetical protein
MMPSWFCQSYLFWASKRWGTQHVTQLIQLGSISVTHSLYTKQAQQRKKKSCMYLKVNIDDNPSHSNISVICLDWAACSFSLTLLLFSSLRWQWEHHCCIQNSEQHDHHLQLSQHSLKCLMYDNILKKSVIHVFDSWYNCRNQHTWLWIRIALMYDNWWVLIWFNVIHCCTNKTFTLSSTRMTIVWESE